MNNEKIDKMRKKLNGKSLIEKKKISNKENVYRRRNKPKNVS